MPRSSAVGTGGSTPPPPGTEPPPTTPAAPPAAPSTSTTYVSDLTPTSASNGWGPVETDMSSGERPGGDGRPITLEGVVYPKGLGTHAPSTVQYALSTCNRFTASVGMDDEVGSSGSVVFQVYVGRSKAFDSGLMTGASATKAVDVAVSGASQLRLVVTNGGDNSNFDHADWADAKLECTGSGGSTPPSTTPPPTTPPVTPPVTPPATPPASTTYLSDVAWTSASNGWGPVEKDMSNGEKAGGDGRPLTLEGTAFQKGIGTHGFSEVRFDVACDTFKASVGLDDEVGANGSAVFQLYAGANKVFDSGVMTGTSATKIVDVAVKGSTWLSARGHERRRQRQLRPCRLGERSRHELHRLRPGTAGRWQPAPGSRSPTVVHSPVWPQHRQVV